MQLSCPIFTKGLLAKLLQIGQRPLMVNDKLCKDKAFFLCGTLGSTEERWTSSQLDDTAADYRIFVKNRILNRRLEDSLCDRESVELHSQKQSDGRHLISYVLVVIMLFSVFMFWELWPDDE